MEEITKHIEKEINKQLTEFDESYDFDDLVYEALDLQYGDKTIGEIFENADTSKNPYYYSYLLTLNAPNSILLKGSINVNQQDISYAWMENDEFVYDVVTKKVVYKDFFYKQLKPKVLGLYHSQVFKKILFQYCIGLKCVENTPELVQQFLSFKKFNKIEPKMVLKILTEIDNEQTKKEVLKFYNIDMDLGHNI